MNDPYDAVLLVSFGGPEGPDEVMPFLENVVRGRNVPRERLLEVAEHYQLFGGRSPINAQNRALLAALNGELREHDIQTPIYWGNRNWHPMLADTIRQMRDDGAERVLAFVTSAFGSYSSCRQYLDDIDRARDEVGPEAPKIDKLRTFFNHPGFIDPMVDHLNQAIAPIPEGRRDEVVLLFTAHSIPLTMAAAGPYEAQLEESCRLVAERMGRDQWQLVYQSRSGPPSQPWLAPDVLEALPFLAREKAGADVCLVPIGFVSDHMEVVFDLDTEARQLADSLGLNLVRAATVGTHPRFITMIRELIEERINPSRPRLALGTMGPSCDHCDPACCIAAGKEEQDA